MEVEEIENRVSDYFESYEDLEVHNLMLNDRPRNEAYRRAILENSDAFKDKTVLDVGAGTGILSVLCAQAGAAKVYAVEASSLYKIALEIVKENNFEGVIEVIHEEVEKIMLPDRVDIIVSEWMGFYLFHEGMLESVIAARDKFLKFDGLMFPESAALYSAPCSVPSMNEYWDNVSGVSMKCFGSHMRQIKSSKPEVMLVAKEHILAESEPIVWFDLNEVTADELRTLFGSQLVAVKQPGRYQGIALWFVCQFPAPNTEDPVVLSTHPGEPATHWKQTVVVLPTDLVVEKDEPIAYEIRMEKVEGDQRKYTIELTMLDPEDMEHPPDCTCYMTKCILTRAVVERYENEVHAGSLQKAS